MLSTILQKLQMYIFPEPNPAVICLTCGKRTLQHQQCCGQPVHIKEQSTIEY